MLNINDYNIKKVIARIEATISKQNPQSLPISSVLSYAKWREKATRKYVYNICMRTSLCIHIGSGEHVALRWQKLRKAENLNLIKLLQ